MSIISFKCFFKLCSASSASVVFLKGLIVYLSHWAFFSITSSLLNFLADFIYFSSDFIFFLLPQHSWLPSYVLFHVLAPGIIYRLLFFSVSPFNWPHTLIQLSSAMWHLCFRKVFSTCHFVLFIDLTTFPLHRVTILPFP